MIIRLNSSEIRLSYSAFNQILAKTNLGEADTDMV